MNKYIDYINKAKQDKEVNEEMYTDLIKGFKSKLENCLMDRPRSSDDSDFIEITTAIYYISNELK